MPISQSTSHAATRKGSVLLVVAAVIVILFLFAGWFFKYMLMQSKQSHRQGEQRITTAVAYALASLAVQKLQFGILKNQDSPLTKFLDKPITQLVDLPRSNDTRFKLDEGKPDMTSLLQELFKPLKDLGSFDYELHFFCKAGDFAPLTPLPYCREKLGLIHLIVTTKYNKKGDVSGEIAEDFHFAIRVKTAAALIPVLSKFNLYVEKANDPESQPAGQEAPWRLNVISTNIQGNVTNPAPGKPIVLYNGKDPPTIPNSLDQMVRIPRGLIYLGGGKVYLNLARGWTVSGIIGEFGEGFHLYKGGNGDGLYTVLWINNEIAIMNWDQGISSDISSSGGADWWDFIKFSENAGHAKLNSMFRLFGTDGQRSPTLVLGEVYRSFICAKACKSIAATPQFRPTFLAFIRSYKVPTIGPTWLEYVNPYPPDEYDSIATFASILFPGFFAQMQAYSKYREAFSSNLAYTPYNLSIGFIMTGGNDPSPLHNFGSDPIVDYMGLPAPGANTDHLHKTPAPFDFISSGKDLKSIKPFIDAMQVPGPRAAWVVDPKAEGETDPLECLRKRSLLSDQDLDLNGWVFVKGSADLTFKKNFRIHSNGGIVLEKGNILVQNELKAVSTAEKSAMLQLVTLDGDITLDTNVKIEAAFAAPKGRVQIGTGGRPQVKGAMAMAKIDVTSASQGAVLEYQTDLAALPAGGGNTDSGEEKLLSFSLDPTLVLLK